MRPWLGMIVKNESPIIERCLAAVKPYVDGFYILDTGSSDDTPEKIKAFMHDLPGMVLLGEWEGFGPSKTRLLQKAKQYGARHILLVDADEVLTFDVPPLSPDSFNWPEGEPAYDIHVGDLTTPFTPQSRILDLVHPWRFEGVLHEYPTRGEPTDCAVLSGLSLVPMWDSARAKDPEKYKKDAALLEAEIEKDPEADIADRYRFYLAQSWKNADQPMKALNAYLVRAIRGGWIEEVFVSWIEAGRAAKRLGRWEDAKMCFERALASLPDRRGEALYELAFVARCNAKYALACAYAEAALVAPYPRQCKLFVDRSVWEWRALDELAVNAQRCGRIDDARKAGEKLIASAALIPPEELLRIIQNHKKVVK